MTETNYGGARFQTDFDTPIQPSTTQEGVYVREIDINDVKNRLTLCKNSTHKEILAKFNAGVSVKGKYYNTRSGERPTRPEDDRPLYLQITAEDEESIKKATEYIREIVLRQPKYLTEKIFVNIPEPHPQFNVGANIIGPKGIYVKYITQKCGGTRCVVKGKGSNFSLKEKEQKEGEGAVMEDEEELHLCITAVSRDNLDKAKKLANSLVEKVRKDHEYFKTEMSKRDDLIRQIEMQMQQHQQQQEQQHYYQSLYAQQYGVVQPQTLPYNSQPVAAPGLEVPHHQPTISSSSDVRPPGFDDDQPKPTETAPVGLPPGVDPNNQEAMNAYYQQYYAYQQYYNSAEYAQYYAQQMAAQQQDGSLNPS